MDGDQLEYDVYEQCEQDTRRKAPAIRGPALQDEQWGSGGVHARDLAGNASVDHPQGLAKKGQIAPSVRSARGIRGGIPTLSHTTRSTPARLHRAEDIGSALKGGVNVCQRQLVDEVLGLLVTEFVPNFGREGATPIQRGSNAVALIAAGIILNFALQALNAVPSWFVFLSAQVGIVADIYSAPWALVLIPGGAFLIWRGRQYAAQASAKRIISDSKPHLLYLRAFRSDPSTAKQAFYALSFVNPLLGLQSEEEQLAEVLQPFGGLIAIGRPGESLPTPGAARIYTSDEEWKDVVKRPLACPGRYGHYA
jgi:hypothetical protein